MLENKIIKFISQAVKLPYALIMLATFSGHVLALTPSAPAKPDQATGQAEAAPGENPQGTETGEYSPIAREYHLKAAFLRYVAKFVEWPATQVSSANINLCVLGLVPSFEAINSINGKEVNNRTLNITKISNISEALKCHMVFISKTEADNIKNIVSAINDKPILDFGDMDNFAEQGGDMNFYILNNRLAIMINPPAVEKSKLKISDRMLKVVTVLPPVDQTQQQ